MTEQNQTTREDDLEACEAVDRLWSEAKTRAEARPLTPESVAIFLSDIKAALDGAPEIYGWCACMGARNGEPECVCTMKRVLRISGRYYRIDYGDPPVISDLGPVRPPESEPERGWYKIWVDGQEVAGGIGPYEGIRLSAEMSADYYRKGGGRVKVRCARIGRKKQQP